MTSSRAWQATQELQRSPQSVRWFLGELLEYLVLVTLLRAVRAPVLAVVTPLLYVSKQFHKQTGQAHTRS